MTQHYYWCIMKHEESDSDLGSGFVEILPYKLMIIFLHKLWILIGKIIFWYIMVGIAFSITAIAILIFAYLIDISLNFIFDFSIFRAIDIWSYNSGLNHTEKVLLFIPLILFFMRPHLVDWSKDDPDAENYSIYNPFSDWGNIVYMKRHKEFYEKHYTNEYIKWKKAEEKKKKRKRRK